MVNTRVKDAQHRAVNRKLDRQTKAMMKQNRNIYLEPLNEEAKAHVDVHRLRIEEYKKDRRLIVERKKVL